MAPREDKIHTENPLARLALQIQEARVGANAVVLQRHLDQLLAPVPGPHPSGDSLRYEGIYDRIAEARREDDAALTQGVWKSELKRADWNQVEKICVEALKTRTKDLQIAAWLLEAWLHLYHFEGVKEGLDLVRELCFRFWVDLHPQIQDGDLDYRIAPIHWINEKLSIQLKLLPVTNPESADVPAYCWSDWENACRTEVNDPRFKSTAPNLAVPKLTPPEFEKSVIFTTSGFLSRMAAELERAMEAATGLESALDTLCGKQAPSLRQFFGVLDSVHAFAMSTLAQRQPEEASHTLLLDPQSTVESEEDGIPGPVFGSSPIASRDEAYRRLAEAAEYLARVEPHSPAPYLVRRAIQWGSLSLPELLPELVRNQAELSEIFRLLQLGDINKMEK
jgi:type VI secretion system protein ImpA